ncbi:hypothetical protein [Streptomyces cucumeris]|uniref:hypothetical protein n=1 Tax=Streptomyces cucumeris TaxID=2962890 RepID=UPI003D721E46
MRPAATAKVPIVEHVDVLQEGPCAAWCGAGGGRATGAGLPALGGGNPVPESLADARAAVPPEWRPGEAVPLLLLS